MLLSVACGWVGGCDGRSPSSHHSGTPTIVATIYPLADLVEQIVGDAANVVCLLPAGRSPHAFELSAGQMAAVSNADLIVGVGLGIDAWVNSAAAAGAKNTRLFTLSEALALADDHAHDQSHDHDHDHEQHHDEPGATDPHVWLDPTLMQQALPAMTEALAKALPDQADDIRRRAGVFEAELILLDREYTEELEPYAGRSIVTFHSAFNGLAKRYGLNIATTLTPIESVGNITPAALNQAIRAIEQYNLKVLFAEPQFSVDAADMLARRTGAAVLILDPIGNPASDDRNGYLPMMRYNLRTLVDGLSR